SVQVQRSRLTLGCALDSRPCSAHSASDVACPMGGRYRYSNMPRQPSGAGKVTPFVVTTRLSSGRSLSRASTSLRFRIRKVWMASEIGQARLLHKMRRKSRYCDDKPSPLLNPAPITSSPLARSAALQHRYGCAHGAPRTPWPDRRRSHRVSFHLYTV